MKRILLIILLATGCCSPAPRTGDVIVFPPDARLVDVHRWMRKHPHLRVEILDPLDEADTWSLRVAGER